jgi:biotin operon repressor
LAGALSTRGEGASQREAGEVCIRQATLGQELGCSRWTIGRAIKKLKEAGLLLETGRDKQSRCKTYALQVPSPLGGEGLGVRVPQPDPGLVAGVTKIPLTPLCQRGEIQLQNYRHLFECNLGNWPDWEKHYAAVTWELKDVECIHKLFRQTFDKLYEIRDRETGLLCQQFTEKQGSDTSFTRMRGRTASCPHRRPWR